MAKGPKPKTLAAKYWRYAVKTDGCWTWIGPTTHGYGVIYLNGTKRTVAHRIAWQLHFGDIPECRACNIDSGRRWREQHPVQSGHHVNHNAAKTHCVHGHPFDTTNTYKDKNGKRQCRTCKQLQRQGLTHRTPKTHCCRGHLMDNVNTNITSSGSRQCRLCANARARQCTARRHLCPTI